MKVFLLITLMANVAQASSSGMKIYQCEGIASTKSNWKTNSAGYKRNNNKIDLIFTARKISVCSNNKIEILKKIHFDIINGKITLLYKNSIYILASKKNNIITLVKIVEMESSTKTTTYRCRQPLSRWY